MVIGTSFIVSLLCRYSYQYGDLKHRDEAELFRRWVAAYESSGGDSPFVSCVAAELSDGTLLTVLRGELLRTMTIVPSVDKSKFSSF
jgi:hypothetical protein